MKRTAIVLAAAFCMTLALACSGGSALSDEAYFQKILDARQAAETSAAEVDIPTGDSTEDAAQVERSWTEYLDALISIAADQHEALVDLNAPDDLDRLHDLYVAADGEAVEALEEYRAQVPTLLTESEPREALEPSERIENATQTLTDLCTDLQDAAGERDVDVDLNCPSSVDAARQPHEEEP